MARSVRTLVRTGLQGLGGCRKLESPRRPEQSLPHATRNPGASARTSAHRAYHFWASLGLLGDDRMVRSDIHWIYLCPIRRRVYRRLDCRGPRRKTGCLEHRVRREYPGAGYLLERNRGFGARNSFCLGAKRNRSQNLFGAPTPDKEGILALVYLSPSLGPGHRCAECVAGSADCA